jgi:hypothetical protein
LAIPIAPLSLIEFQARSKHAIIGCFGALLNTSEARAGHFEFSRS